MTVANVFERAIVAECEDCHREAYVTTFDAKRLCLLCQCRRLTAYVAVALRDGDQA